MKRIIFSLILVFACISYSNAQYSINKYKYDYRTYYYNYGDPYNPTVAGIASFFIPGLGQMMSGETQRGLAFLGGYTGCMVLYSIGAVTFLDNAYTYNYDGSFNNDSRSTAGGGLMLVGILGAVAVEIWSIVDAVQVAKVNNLALRDRYRSSIDINLKPYIDTYRTPAQQNSLALGMSLRISY